MKDFNAQVIDRVLQRIEADLDNAETDALIAYSGFSRFHFHRLFTAYAGESLKQYVKRIRLERAARELNYKKAPVTEVALKAGYQTPSAFNRAFLEFFGANPTAYRKQQPLPKEYAMIEPVRIETLKPFEVYAARHTGDYKLLGQAWERLMKFVYRHQMKHGKTMLSENTWAIGIAYDNPEVTPINKLRSDACVSVIDEVELEPGIERKTVAGGKYAVFLHKGSYDGLGETYKNIFGGWVRGNDAQLRDEPVFERYLNRDPKRTKPENLRTEIYLPIV